MTAYFPSGWSKRTMNALAGPDELRKREKAPGFGLDLPTCERLLRASTAYRWLKSATLAESALYVPRQGRLCATKTAGDSLIGAVDASAKVSRGRRIATVCVDFLVDWDPFLFVQEQEYNSPLAETLPFVIALTGYGNNVQATTCEEYMRQTWPESGPLFLSFLQRAAAAAAAAATADGGGGSAIHEGQ